MYSKISLNQSFKGTIMIPVYAISTGKIESLQYNEAKPMQSAINKQPLKVKCGCQN